MGSYRKFGSILLATILAALVPVLGDNVVTPAEWVNVVIMAFGSATVLGATNLPAGTWRFAKVIFAVGSAVAVVVASALTDGTITVTELIQMVLAALSVVGVGALPNAGALPNGASTVATGLPVGQYGGPETA